MYIMDKQIMKIHQYFFHSHEEHANNPLQNTPPKIALGDMLMQHYYMYVSCNI